MIRLRYRLAFFSVSGLFLAISFAQTPADTTSGNSSELLDLAKKIDQQNTKIDLLSQQILKLQQEIEHPKTVLGTEGAPRATEVASPVPTGNTHIVAKGETLTSIARMHKVSVEELQKFNHIENDRKLQIGQTLVVPGPSAAATSASATPSPSPSASSPNE